MALLWARRCCRECRSSILSSSLTVASMEPLPFTELRITHYSPIPDLVSAVYNDRVVSSRRDSCYYWESATSLSRLCTSENVCSYTVYTFGYVKGVPSHGTTDSSTLSREPRYWLEICTMMGKEQESQCNPESGRRKDEGEGREKTSRRDEAKRRARLDRSIYPFSPTQADWLVYHPIVPSNISTIEGKKKDQQAHRTGREPDATKNAIYLSVGNAPSKPPHPNPRRPTAALPTSQIPSSPFLPHSPSATLN